LTPDPIGLAGGLNLYSYAGQNPINYVDPLGLYSWGQFWADVQGLTYVTNPTMWVADQLGDVVASLLPEGLRKGTIFGTGFGEEAVDYWASRYNRTHSAVDLVAGIAASRWTEDNWFGTASTLACSMPIGRMAGVPRSYWQYYPKNTPAYRSPWYAPSTSSRAPYALGQEARSALNLPPYNSATAVRRANIRWWQPMKNPRRPAPQPFGWPLQGWGYESQRGWLWLAK